MCQFDIIPPTAAEASIRKRITERNNVSESYGKRNRLIIPPAKRNRAFPTGNALLYISLSSVAFGRVRPGGRTLFLFHRGWVYIKTHLPVLFLLGCIVIGFALFHHLGEPFHHCRVVVSKEGTGFGIQ